MGLSVATSDQDPGGRSIHRLGRAFDALENALAFGSAVFLFVIVILITADVLGRRLFDWSLPWIVEVAEYFLLFATFMASAWVLREGGHIKVDFFENSLTPRARKMVAGVGYLLTAATTVFVLWFAYAIVIRYYKAGSMQGNFLLVPQWTVFAPIPAGLSLFLVELFRQAYRFSKR